MADYTKIHLDRSGGAYGQDITNLLTNIIALNPKKKIIIGTNRSQEVFINKPMFLPSNTVLEINATLALTDGVVRPITQDAIIGQNRVYVNNSDGAYKVGQVLTVSALNYPTGGGGNIARKLGQSGIVVGASLTYVDFELPLRNTMSGISVGNVTVANTGTIGHAQTMFYARTQSNIYITGTGLLDGKFETMQNTYHPNDMGTEYSALAGYETVLGGNCVAFRDCTNVKFNGKSEDSKLKLQEFNIGGVLLTNTDIYEYRNIESYHPYMKHFAGTLGVRYGRCENVTMLDSYNEDGLGMHDEVTNSTFKNIDIDGCPRLGFTIGSGCHDNYFENISVVNSKFAFYTYPSNVLPASLVRDNYIKNLTISNCDAGIIMAVTENTTFENLNISFIKNTNHCITIGGNCENINFVGGGCYDTEQLNRNGWGYRMVPKEGYHTFDSFDIFFEDFDFIRLKIGVVDAGGLCPTTFTECNFDDNDDNGDLDSPYFTFIDCTVDGLPYP